MIVSLNAKIAFENPVPHHENSLGEIRDTRNILKHKKGNTQQANIKLNAEKFKAIPLNPDIRQGYQISTYLINILLTVLARAIRQQQQKIKGIQIRMKEIKVSLFANDMTLYICNPKNPIKELLCLH